MSDKCLTNTSRTGVFLWGWGNKKGAKPSPRPSNSFFQLFHPLMRRNCTYDARQQKQFHPLMRRIATMTRGNQNRIVLPTKVRINPTQASIGNKKALFRGLTIPQKTTMCKH